MEVREGYKKTEMGVIPGDWEVINLAEKSTLKARIGWQGLTTKEYLSFGNYYLVTGTDLIDNQIDWRNCCYVDKSRYEQDKNIQIKDGDLLVTKDGTIGKIAYIENMKKPATLNSGVFVIRPVGGSYLPKYLFYVLSSTYFVNFLKQLTAGSTIIHLYQKDFVKFNFLLPPLPEQQAIAEALSDVDAVVSSLTKLINKKKNIKQGAMQELLTGKKRLEGFDDKWVEVELGDICEIKKGQMITEKEIEPGKVPVIAGGKQPAYYHRYANRKGKTITISASGANAGYVSFHQEPIFASDCSTIEESKNYDIIFIFSALLLKQPEIYNAQTGGAQPHIHPRDLKPLRVLTPSNVEEQTSIASILSDMDAEIEALEQKLNKYKAIKQGMMHELLTGRIRLI
jgi:type I restriction enzyme S subunit